MPKIIKYSLFALFLLSYSSIAFGAVVKFDFQPTSLDFIVTFDKGYSNVDAIKNDKNIVISFETAEDIAFTRQDFFDQPVSSAWLTSDNYRKRLYFSFETTPIQPTVTKTEKGLKISFPIAESPAVTPDQANQVRQPSYNSAGAYVRMLFGLFIVVVIIIGMVWAMKKLLKTDIVTDIPGAGRLLGKVNLEMKKSLAFYELGNVIYILGVTENGISTIDKVVNEVEINLIKAGFARKKEFTGYFNFFSKKNEISDDMTNSAATIGEKLASLRKK